MTTTEPEGESTHHVVERRKSTAGGDLVVVTMLREHSAWVCERGEYAAAARLDCDGATVDGTAAAPARRRRRHPR